MLRIRISLFDVLEIRLSQLCVETMITSDGPIN